MVKILVDSIYVVPFEGKFNSYLINDDFVQSKGLVIDDSDYTESDIKVFEDSRNWYSWQNGLFGKMFNTNDGSILKAEYVK